MGGRYLLDAMRFDLFALAHANAQMCSSVLWIAWCRRGWKECRGSIEQWNGVYASIRTSEERAAYHRPTTIAVPVVHPLPSTSTLTMKMPMRLTNRSLVCTIIFYSMADLMHQTEHLCGTWNSVVYSFFKSNVTIGYDNCRKYHFFLWAATKCHNKGLKGIWQYQHSKDLAATSNLKTHGIHCFREDVVDVAFGTKESKCPDGSILVSFACQGQQPVKVSHRVHTSDETRSVSLLFHSS